MTSQETCERCRFADPVLGAKKDMLEKCAISQNEKIMDLADQLTEALTRIDKLELKNAELEDELNEYKEADDADN